MTRNFKKKVENEKCTLQDLEYGEKTYQKAKSETHMVGPGIWRETLKNMKNQNCTLQDLEYGEKTENLGKMRNTHFMT